MKTKFLTYSLIAVALMLFAISCDGEDRAIDPEGLQGEQGIQGPAGPQGEDGQNGEDGEDGQDGNANVIASDWLELSDYFFEPTLEDGVSKSFSDSNLTKDVVDNAAILAYGKKEGLVNAIPFIKADKYYSFRVVSSPRFKIITFY